MDDLLSPPSGETDLLRLLTCGSVDDGKSTLIGRLLQDTQSILTDQMAALQRDSRRHGTTGGEIDLALLLDGLEAEREQGITIDVAYRFMATPRRRFIIADTPGHEQYTRNMVTGASTADLAILLVDARRGIQTQTRRHAFICSLLGIRDVVLAVNKIDLADYDERVFEQIRHECDEICAPFNFESLTAIPISARYGDNVTIRSANTSWYHGPVLLEHLETVQAGGAETQAFRLPVQWVNRPNADFRGFAGTIAGGLVRPGDPVVVALSGRRSTVARIVTMDGDLAEARAGDAVTVTLADEVDVSRGDVLAAPADLPEVSDQFAVDLVWMGDAPLLPGRPYLFRIGTATVAGSITRIKHRIDVNNFERLAAAELGMNELACCNISLAAPVAFDPYTANRRTGGFIVIDRMTNATVGAGMVRFGLRRASNIHRQATTVDASMRTALNQHKPAVLWFTGLSGAGKSTIANLVESRLHAMGVHTYLLDGDNVRHGLNRDLGFTDADRVENIRRVAEVAKLFVDAGTVVLVSFISPFRAERQMARDLIGADAFLEVFVDAPIELCRARDPKGLYRKADAGQIKNFTGIDSPYEAPLAPDILLKATEGSAADHAEILLRVLEPRIALSQQDDVSI